MARASEAVGASIRGEPASSVLSIAICTFRRPALLAGLLADLTPDREALARDGAAGGVEVLVVDNDPAGSAREVAASSSDVRYLVEPRPGIVAARNAAARAVRGEVVLWVDDDQRLAPGTLALAWQSWRRRPVGVDGLRFGVLRLPDSGQLPPVHVPIRSFAYRPLCRGRAATNGLMVARALLTCADPPFDPAYDRRFGEDVDFYLRAVAGGARFALVEEVVLYERVPRERDAVPYVLRRGFVTGWMDTWFDRRYPTLGAIGSRPSTRLPITLARLLLAPVEMLRHEPHLLWGRLFRLGYLVGRLAGQHRGGLPPIDIGAGSSPVPRGRASGLGRRTSAE